MLETFIALICIQFAPIIYMWGHDRFGKLPYVDIFEILSIPILITPIILSSIGVPKVARNAQEGPILEPTKTGYIVSIILWIILDLLLAIALTSII